jgi:4-aminobutyrate aminotransferase
MASMPRIIHGVKHVMPDVTISSAKGSYLFTECGREFLDFSCGIGVTNLGHSHDGVTKAVQNMAPKLVHAQQNIFKHRPLVDLVHKLASFEIAKKAGFDSWFMWNSGSEGVEASIKLARHATGIHTFNLVEVLCFICECHMYTIYLIPLNMLRPSYGRYHMCLL